MNNAYYTAIGIDVSDRKSQICVMSRINGNLKVVQEATIPTTKDGFGKFLATQDKASPVTFETGTHCRWMSEVAAGMGFKVYVANPCRLKMITESKTKNDVNDARTLARMTLADVGLLHPVKLRGAEHQKMINLHEMRNILVKQRTGVIVQMRCIAKSMGFRIPKCSTTHFHNLDTASWPKELNDIAWPMMRNLEQLAITIKTYEKKIGEMATKLVDHFFNAALQYTRPSVVAGPYLAQEPDEGAFVYAIADVINSNLQPAMKLLGDIKWQVLGDKLAADKAVTKKEKRMAESPARVQAYLDAYAVTGVDAEGNRTYGVNRATIDAIRRIAQKFQVPADLAGRDGGTGAFKVAANRALFLSTMRFNLDLLEKELREEGLIPADIGHDLRRHIARIATQFFADRIGGIGDAVRKLSNKVYGKLVAEASNPGSPQKLLFTVDVLDHLRNPLRLPRSVPVPES